MRWSEDADWGIGAAHVLQALDEVFTAPTANDVALGYETVLAASTWGSYSSVITLFREPEHGQGLLYNTYFMGQDALGRWVPPRSSSGAAYPEWVLHRPGDGGDLADWRGAQLAVLGGQFGFVDGIWIIDLTVMASLTVVEARIAYMGREVRKPVPPSGVLMVPAPLSGDANEAATFTGYDAHGDEIAHLNWPVADEETLADLTGITERLAARADRPESR